MESDESLVARFLAGDEAAFEGLVERYETRLRRLAYGYLRRGPLAEDVVQDSFLQAYQKLPSLGRHRAFRSWLYRIVINRCHDELRRSSRESELPDEKELEGELRRAQRPPSSEQVVESKELGRRLAAAIASLPKKHSTPLVLKEVQGMTYAEIADLLGWPVGTVQIRIHRARLQLRDELGGERGKEE